LSLSACESNYQAFNDRDVIPYGHQEKILNTKGKPYRYLLTYKGHASNSKTTITKYWHQRASALCPNGYRVVSFHESIAHGSIRTPINGMLTTVGTQAPINRGEIICQNSNSQSIKNDIK